MRKETVVKARLVDHADGDEVAKALGALARIRYAGAHEVFHPLVSFDLSDDGELTLILQREE